MGTNYYLRTNICSKCKRYDEAHIGKKSSGWEFSFEGTDKIKSFKDWRKEIKKGKIYDEYGEDVPEKGFLKMVRESKDGKNWNHYKKCKDEYGEDTSCINDAEGYSISFCEFC